MTKDDLEMLMEKTHSAMSEAYVKTTDQALTYSATPIINGKRCN
jgi:hypothetical protein